MENLSGPRNRWERISLGEKSSRSTIAIIAQFAGELELRTTKLPKNAPKDSSIVYKSLLDLLYVALQGDILLDQEIKHFKEVGDEYEVNRLSGAFTFMRGHIAEDTESAYGPNNSNEERLVFGTTRSWTNTSGAPHILGERNRNKLRVRILRTSDAANPYNNEVLPGIDEIIIGEKGDMIVSGWRRGYLDERPKMNIIRKHLLASIFDNCKNGLSNRLESGRKYFQQIKSSSLPQGF